MSKKIKLEYDIKDKKYQWDLKRSIFHKNETPESVIAEWYKNALILDKTGKDLYRSAKKFKEWIELYIKVDALKTKWKSFIIHQLKDSPKATKWKSLDRKSKKLEQKIDNSKNVFGGHVILKYEKKIREYLKLEELRQYKMLVEREFFAFKGHILSKQDARTIDAIAADQALDIIYNGLMRDCKEVPVRATNSKGKEFTAESYGPLFKNTDPSIRQSAWANFYMEYRRRSNTLSFLFYLLNYRSDQEARMFHYDSYLEKDLAQKYGISVKTYVQILKNARLYKDLYIRYKDHLAGIINSVFKIEKFEPWDTYLDECLGDVKYTPEQARDIILEAFKVFGDEYVSIVRKMFKSKMIQWHSKDGGLSNFTITGDGVLHKEPILVDFDGDTSSVSTLAHEISHSIASYYGKRHQKTYKLIPRLLGEIPSCAGAATVLMHIIGTSKDKNQVFCAVNHLLNYSFSAINIFSADCLFKEGLNYKIKKEGNLGPGALMRGYYLYRNEYQGLTKSEKSWFRADYPHYLYGYDLYEKYYDNFYDNRDITYFIGQIVGLAIASSLLCGSKKVLGYYLKFIKTGGSKKPLDALKILKFDIFNPTNHKWVKDILRGFVKFYEDNYITYNKPGSTKYGRFNKFGKAFKKK